jgi:hypothetical protein
MLKGNIFVLCTTHLLTIRPDYDKTTTPEEVFRHIAMELTIPPKKEGFGNPLVYFCHA